MLQDLKAEIGDLFHKVGFIIVEKKRGITVT